MQRADRVRIAAWLLACCALVFLTVVVGGVTRLTRSGLSIVEWQPLIGVLPPLSAADWQLLFDKYRLTPEFQKVNPGMGLEGFKSIFWWEYAHRLLGRLIGVAFFLPYLLFLIKGKIRGTLAWQLAGVFLLGALQGALGWYMVQSGLVSEPRVSHFRLTAHLGLALLIFSLMFWRALDLLFPGRKTDRRGVAVAALVFLMILSGGMVAGLRAGHAYNTFPLMNGHLVPPEILMLEPWYRNFFYNVATVQFVHRGLFWVLLVAVPLLWWRTRSGPAALLLAAFVAQAALGISTLLLAVPIPIAAMHQAGAVLVLAAALWAAHASGKPAR
jgi:cytochrome c oxidase assembly protein subunit 15